jgi:hypothetical protein
MTFVQIIDFETTKADEMTALMAEWAASAQGERIPTVAMLGHDRDNPRHYMEMVEFPSYEEAMRNSQMPQTQEFAARMTALCTSGPRFVNLDIERRDT